MRAGCVAFVANCFTDRIFISDFTGAYLSVDDVAGENVFVRPTAECRFQPSCSQYAIEALKTHGAVTGGWLAAKRVCRCHPWGECGEDAVPPQSQ